MWHSISLVTSGITLAAFLAAVAAAAYVRWAAQNEKLIRSAPAKERARLVEQALATFHIDAAQLTRGQQFELAMEQIRARRHRSAIASATVLAIAVIAGGVATFSILREPESGIVAPTNAAAAKPFPGVPAPPGATDFKPMYGPTPIDRNATYVARAVWANLKHCKSALCDVRLHVEALNSRGKILFQNSTLVTNWREDPDASKPNQDFSKTPISFRRPALDGGQIRFRGGDSIRVRVGCEVQDGDVQYSELLILDAHDLHTVFATTCANDWTTVEVGFAVQLAFN